MVNLGFIGVYIIFLIPVKKRGGFSEYPQKYETNQNFYLNSFSFGGKIFYIFEYARFVMGILARLNIFKEIFIHKIYFSTWRFNTWEINICCLHITRY